MKLTMWSGVFTDILTQKNNCKRCFPTGFISVFVLVKSMALDKNYNKTCWFSPQTTWWLYALNKDKCIYQWVGNFNLN